MHNMKVAALYTQTAVHTAPAVIRQLAKIAELVKIKFFMDLRHITLCPVDN